MPVATDAWILVNIRETWREFSQVVTAEQFLSPFWNPMTDYFPITETEMQFRSPIAYMDREISFTDLDRENAPVEGFGEEYTANEGAAVGIIPWGPKRPPKVPLTLNGASDGQQEWSQVKMLDTVFEHDNSGRNGLVACTQSLYYTSNYIEIRVLSTGEWVAIGEKLTVLLFASDTGT